jgi:hypothetical protein
MMRLRIFDDLTTLANKEIQPKSKDHIPRSERTDLLASIHLDRDRKCSVQAVLAAHRKKEKNKKKDKNHARFRKAMGILPGEIWINHDLQIVQASHFPKKIMKKWSWQAKWTGVMFHTGK